MNYKELSLDELIENMKAIGEMLVAYNYPKALPPLMEDELAFFKEKEVVVDGYTLFIHYQKSDYRTHFLETLQIYNKYSPFLPFNLVCKLGKKFLGENHLSLIEIFRDNRKIYCWSVCSNKNGHPIPLQYDADVESCQFEGFDYLYMQPNQADFF
jgi:hypothetical protein